MTLRRYGQVLLRGTQTLLSHDKLWNAVSALSAAAAAWFAFQTVQQSRQADMESLSAGRPYLQFDVAHIRGAPPRVSFKVTNTGQRPVTDLEIFVLMAAPSSSGRPSLVENVLASANEIAPGSFVSYESEKTLDGDAAVNPQNVVIAVAYSDPRLNRRFSQRRFLYWRGPGPDSELFFQTASAREQMLTRFADDLRKYAE